MAVCFTGQHIYVQFIDDRAGQTLAAASYRTAEGKLAANVKMKPLAAPPRAPRWIRASRPSCLIAGVRYITARSRRWRMPREAGLKF